MLKKLRLKNYRGFELHELTGRELTVIVGYNNAGKSTIVEVLRIVGLVTERISGLNIKKPPPWTGLGLVNVGVTPSLEGIGIQFQTIANGYSDELAEAEATFTSGESIHIYLEPEGRCFVVLRDAKGDVLRTKGKSEKANFPNVQVLPQITPLEENETILRDDYVRRNRSSPLASKHFRNQLRVDPGAYQRFRALATETWSGIQIAGLEGAKGNPGDTLRLMIRDRNFVAEAGLMGHGLQMWLQTMWFLSRAEKTATVVLDEPDVYMHPDLQRKLIRVIKNMFPQVIIATHSVEIVAELDPSEILIVDRTQRRSLFADSLPAVQKLIESIGGVHNVHLSRLWSARRCILVEGDDLSYLKLVHDKIYPDADLPLDDIPNSSIGGWDGWHYGVGQSMFAKNALGQTLKVYCILDSDYHPPEEIEERFKDAKSRSVELYVWRMKEIENYFLVPAALARLIASRNTKLAPENVEDAVREKMAKVVLSLKDVVFDGFSTRFRDRKPAGGVAAANRQPRDLLGIRFDDPEVAKCCVSGKEVLKQLSSWSHEVYGRGFSLRDVLRSLTSNEIHPEMRAVIKAIETTGSLPNREL